MLPKHHFLFGILFSIALYPFFGFYCLIALAATVLIDVDHYLDYVAGSKFKDWSLKNAYNRCKKDDKPSMMIFHVVEFWAVVGILSFYSSYTFLMFIGIMFHMFLDVFNKVKKEFSLLWWLIKK